MLSDVTVAEEAPGVAPLVAVACVRHHVRPGVLRASTIGVAPARFCPASVRRRAL
ncbi:MAG TPA: hypothetical protein VES40_00250 [Ilumatobacteraceae bacterium]|nr:hypothetical protein [Ilumatobacteraceae bacterium]